MAFRAAVSVLLGGNFNQASKLLSAAERGEERQVKEVLTSKPQLAAFSGWHGTTSPLHRAVSAGHLSVVVAILDLLKRRITLSHDSNGQPTSSTRRWRSLYKKIIDQRTHMGQTPLMLACQHGHAQIAALLITEGADPLLVDFMHCRTALHYAALHGKADCVGTLLSPATIVTDHGVRRQLRDVVTQDIQVGSAKYVDQRSFGGLTALHFAAVSGNLATVQALLRGGASILVKTDGEAFIGSEYLTPGSTPLHVAVIIGSLPMAHALLAAHADLMTAVLVGRDARRRRPWEGHSRTDIRSVRNSQKKLPYHLARDKGLTQIMHLVDPRIAVDSSLDAARDTEHGIGPKRLSTICSVVLQTSLLHWLDDCAKEKETVAGQSPFATISRGLNTRDSDAAQPTTPPGEDASPAIRHTDTGSMNSTDINAVSNRALASNTTNTSTPPRAIPTSEPAVSSLGIQSSPSLHAYVGMLSKRRQLPRSASAILSVGTDGLVQSNTTHRSLSFRGNTPLHRRNLTMQFDGAVLRNPMMTPPRGGENEPTAFLRARSTSALQQYENMNSSNVLGRAFSSLRDRLLSIDVPIVADGTETPKQHHASHTPKNRGEQSAATTEKGYCASSSSLVKDDDADSCCCGTCASSVDDNPTVEDEECGVCLDSLVEVAFSGCEHALCIECARHLTKQEKKPPSCPFCRRMVVGFHKVSDLKN